MKQLLLATFLASAPDLVSATQIERAPLLTGVPVAGCEIQYADQPIAVDEGFALPAAAMDCLRAAAVSGHPEAAFRLALHYSSGSNASPGDSRYWLLIAAENGHAVAPYNIWFADHESLDGVARARALFWLEKSAERGVARAKEKLSTQPAGRPISLETASLVGEAPAPDKSPAFMTVVAGCEIKYFDQPLAVDEGFALPASAMDCLRSAAVSGNPEAAFRLSLHYSSGSNASQEDARFWRLIGAENGHAGSQYTIWFRDHDSSDELVRERAMFWLERAAEVGHERAETELSRIQAAAEQMQLGD